MSTNRDWEVKLVRAPNHSDMEPVWNEACRGGWEPFAVYVSSDLSHVVMHLKRRREVGFDQGINLNETFGRPE